jgi:hypothetical protein
VGGGKEKWEEEGRSRRGKGEGRVVEKRWQGSGRERAGKWKGEDRAVEGPEQWKWKGRQGWDNRQASLQAGPVKIGFFSKCGFF